ncbi:MAG: hypothetical protein RL154_1188 [Pseudomonadota bacterium]
MKRGLVNVLFIMVTIGGLSTLFASSGGGEHTDIAPRTLNFLIFAGILYYLLADPIKTFFADRKSKISTALEARENKLKAAKAALKDAEEYLVSSKKLAEELIKTANSDVTLGLEKSKQAVQNEIALLEKHYNEDCEFLKKKTVMRAVEEELNQIFTLKGYGVSDEEFAKIFAKKVAK